MNETKQDPFYQDLNQIYREREDIFRQREQDYLKQKNALNNLLEVIKQEKGELEKAAEEQKRKKDELEKEEQHQQAWYQQICEERKQIHQEQERLKKVEEEFNSKKEAIEVRYRVQIEKAKNTEILAKQKKEEFEHKLEMLGLVLDADGKPGEESTKFFEALLGRTENVNAEEMQALETENIELQKQVQRLEKIIEDLKEKQEQLKEKNEQISQEREKVENEKNRLLEFVSSISQKKETSIDIEKKEDDVPNFGTEEEEYVPTFGRKQPLKESDMEDEIFEELTASILQKYLSRNEAKYISSEIKHSEEGEQLHANINNLDYVFLFSQPAAFEISTPKKKSRALERLLVRLNTQHPGVKFYFDEKDSRVYASGYFSNIMTPEKLMKKVHEVSDCFRQK